MIQIENLHKSYFTGGEPLHVLKGINLSVAEGELVSIMGSSGSGKSTLLNILGILDNYDEGTYHLNGELVEKDIRKARVCHLPTEKEYCEGKTEMIKLPAAQEMTLLTAAQVLIQFTETAADSISDIAEVSLQEIEP